MGGFMLHNIRLLFSTVYIAALISRSFFAYANVTLDGSLGQAGSLSGPDFRIDAAMGRQVGNNLFHSFGQFSLDKGQSATFTDIGTTGSVANILSRVTGGDVSRIDGLIRTQFANDQPNLFLMNPAGVIFGPNASLDVQGSFHVTTADYLRLSDGVKFNAIPSGKDALLSISPVEAFGFIGNTSNPISITGNKKMTSPSFATNIISLIGGNIFITNRNLYGKQINIVSTNSPSEVFINKSYSTSSLVNMGLIDIKRSSVNSSGDGSGEIYMRCGQLNVESSDIRSDTLYSGGSLGGINISSGDINLINGTQISASIMYDGYGIAGNVVINAKNVLISGRSFIVSDNGKIGFIPSGIFAQTYEIDNAGSLYIDADNIVVANGGIIDTSTFGAGNGGDLSINAKRISVISDDRTTGNTIKLSGDAALNNNVSGYENNLYASGIFSTSTFNGNAGLIDIKSGGLILKNGSLIDTSTFREGKGGNLLINAKNIEVTDGSLIEASTFYYGSKAGPGGNISIKTDNLKIFNSGQISASSFFGYGNGGNLNINANDIVISGDNSGFLTGIAAATDKNSSGNAGDLFITTKRLQMDNRAAISVGTVGKGKGGMLTIQSDNVTLNNGSRISSRSLGKNSDAGASGNINITTTREMSIKNNSRISVETTRASAGNIHIQGGKILSVSNYSNITTSAAVVDDQGTGNGGNIFINPSITILDNNSSIVAKAAKGGGGKINIESDYLFRSPDSVISASSAGGSQGTVTIKSPDSNITNSILKLSASILTTKLDERCTNRANELGKSSFKQGHRKELYAIPGITGLPLSTETNINENKSILKNTKQNLKSDNNFKFHIFGSYKNDCNI